jgi:hypothetical protein
MVALCLCLCLVYVSVSIPSLRLPLKDAGNRTVSAAARRLHAHVCIRKRPRAVYHQSAAAAAQPVWRLCTINQQQRLHSCWAPAAHAGAQHSSRRGLPALFHVHGLARCHLACTLGLGGGRRLSADLLRALYHLLLHHVMCQLFRFLKSHDLRLSLYVCVCMCIRVRLSVCVGRGMHNTIGSRPVATLPPLIAANGRQRRHVELRRGESPVCLLAAAAAGAAVVLRCVWSGVSPVRCY